MPAKRARSKPISQQRAEALVEYWRDALGLQQWSFSVRLVTASTLPGKYACVSWFAEEERFTIWLRQHQADHEGSILHELLHVRYEGKNPSGRMPVDREIAHNRVTEALMWLKYGAQ